jgi:hypothetical protein
MRHTYASLLLRDGAPIIYVSRQLGHRDASITLRCMRTGCPMAQGSKESCPLARAKGCHGDPVRVTIACVEVEGPIADVADSCFTCASGADC